LLGRKAYFTHSLNVPETPDEDCIEVIHELRDLTLMMPRITSVIIYNDRAHRTGKNTRRNEHKHILPREGGRSQER